MEDIIHENVQAAKQACRKYLTALYVLQEQFGVWEESVPESVAINCRYRDNEARVKILSYNI
jgi:hypothetical protein